MKRQETFSIRKLSIGAASVLLGTFLVAGQGQVVSADEQVDEVVTLAQATDDSDSQTTVVESIEIASPVTYVADETQEVGYHEVEVAGQAGQLIISETDGVTTAERIEPTASREVYGTKPEVVEEILEKATTEYVANDELEAGEKVVKQEGVDGKKVTTTSYRVQVQETKKSEIIANSTYEGKTAYTIDDTQKLPSDKVVIDEEAIKNKLTDLTEDDWIAVLADSVNQLSHYAELSKGSSQAEHIEKFFETHAVTEAEYVDIKAAYILYQEAVNYFNDNYTDEELKNLIIQSPKGTQLVGGFYQWQDKSLLSSSNYSEVETVINVDLTRSNIPELDYSFDSNEYFRNRAIAFVDYLETIGVVAEVHGQYGLLIDGFSYRIESERLENPDTETTWRYYLGDGSDTNTYYNWETIDSYGPTRNAVYKDYLYQKLDKEGISYKPVSSNQVEIDGIVYDINISASGRYKKLDETDLDYRVTNLTAQQVREKFEELVQLYETAYETHTKRYNNQNGYADDFNIVFETTEMSDEDKAWFLEQVAKLPTALKQVLVKVTVQDEGSTISANNLNWVGIAYTANSEIKLSYKRAGSKERLLKVLLHELSHVIDGNAQWVKNSLEFSGHRVLGASGYAVSHNRGDLDDSIINPNSLYLTYFNPDIDKESPAVRPYYRDYIGESFAEFFSDYIMSKNFTDYQPVKFYYIGGDEGEDGILTLRAYDWGSTEEEIAKNRENFEKYYNDPAAYAPAKEAEWWFAKLYTALFEQPTTAEVVVDQITTEVIDVQQKIVEVGTKTQVVEQITAYTTIEREDADLLIGEKRVIQVGKDGIVKETTSYELVDKTTGEVVATTTSEVIQELVEEIIAVGTKVAEVVEPEVETPTEEPSVSEPEIEVPTESPVEEEKPEEVVETPTEEPSATPEVTEEPSVDEPASEPEVETPTEEPTSEEASEPTVETPAEETVTAPEVTGEPSVEENTSSTDSPAAEEEISAIPDYAPEEDELPEYVFDPADFQDVLEPSQEEVSDKESSNQAGGAAATANQDKPKNDSLSGIGSSERPVITATATAPSYSRIARATAEKSLPNTGDSSALFSLVGFGLTAFGLVGRKRRRV